VGTPSSIQSNNVTIAYRLIDDDSSQITINVEFSLDAGNSWDTTPVLYNEGTDGSIDLSFGTISGLTSSPNPGTLHNLVWDSAWILEPVGASSPANSVKIRITPQKTVSGNAVQGQSIATNNFTVDNTGNTSPRVSISNVSGSQGDIQIDYSLYDLQSDICSISVQYSVNAGQSWSTAIQGSGGNSTSNLSASPFPGAQYTYVWDSVANNVATASANNLVRIRITPSDTETGNYDESSTFTVDNSGGGGGDPALTISNFTATGVDTDGSDGTITIQFNFDFSITNPQSSGGVFGVYAAILEIYWFNGVTQVFEWKQIYDDPNAGISFRSMLAASGSESAQVTNFGIHNSIVSDPTATKVRFQIGINAVGLPAEDQQVLYSSELNIN